MKIVLFTLFILINSLSIAQVDTVMLHVNILGRPYPNTTYHHPIEGLYLIKKFEKKELSKKQLELFRGYEFINPSSNFKNSINHRQANSLRHYIDTEELLYLHWNDNEFDTYDSIVQNFIDSSKHLRQTKYQTLVQNYFNPFFIKLTEVSNKQYHQFVNWVRDSIMMEEIFIKYPDFSKAKQVLNIPKNEILTDTTNRKLIRKKYHLNFNWKHKTTITDESLVPVLSDFYLNPSERWYKSKEFDVRTLNYYVNDSTAINIYPDTLKWYKFNFTRNDPFKHMYFWHPAYANYPVVGVSKIQAELYCKWKNQQFLNKIGELNLPFNISIELPSVVDYENTIHNFVQSWVEKYISDDEIITDLELERDYTKKLPPNKYEYGQQPYLIYTVKTYASYLSKKKSKKYVYFDLNYDNPKKMSKEFKALLNQKIEQDNLNNDIYFLSNNVSEWMIENYEDNYEQLAKAYINYNCFASIDYCEGQRIVDEKHIQNNDQNGYLIYGSNWYNERYGSYLGINKAGLYPKSFKSPKKTFATVGFRYVIRILPK